jgi:hypothetical protein
MYSRALGVALLLHFGESVAAFLDCLLVLLSKVNLLSDACSKVLLFALKHLVVSGEGSNFATILDDALVSCGNLLFNCHGLL